MRASLAAQRKRLQRDTEEALGDAARLGSPTLTLTEAARLAGVSRSTAYSSSRLGRKGGTDDVGNADCHSAMADSA
jgi:hypothetical protein